MKKKLYWETGIEPSVTLLISSCSEAAVMLYGNTGEILRLGLECWAKKGTGTLQGDEQPDESLSYVSQTCLVTFVISF